eukprot:tig00000540_g1932.t1
MIEVISGNPVEHLEAEAASGGSYVADAPAYAWTDGSLKEGQTVNARAGYFDVNAFVWSRGPKRAREGDARNPHNDVADAGANVAADLELADENRHEPLFLPPAFSMPVVLTISDPDGRTRRVEGDPKAHMDALHEHQKHFAWTQQPLAGALLRRGADGADIAGLYAETTVGSRFQGANGARNALFKFRTELLCSSLPANEVRVRDQKELYAACNPEGRCLTKTFPHVFLCPERPTASQRRRQEPSLPPTWSQSSSASRTTTPKRAATMTLLERARRLWSRRCDINAEWERNCRISQASKKRPRPPRTGARARERARGPRTCKETAHRSTRAGRRRSAPKSSTIASRHH